MFVALAVGVLIHAFIEDDFSVRYVAENSNSALPLFYRVTALWGAHEGSMLLWILVLACGPWRWWRALRYLPPRVCGRARWGCSGIMSFGFLLFTLADLRSVRARSRRCRPTATISIRCCRIRHSRSIRRFSTWAMSALP